MITTVYGIAKNGKEGALVITDKNEPVYVDGLDAWDSELLNKSIEVTGTLSVETLSEEDLKNEQGEWKQGISGQRKILLNASWKLKE